MAGVTAAEAVMVGDSFSHDIAGARGVGMQGILVHRSGVPIAVPEDVRVISSLAELPGML